MEEGSLARQAYQTLEAMIVTTELLPGAAVTLRELAELSGFRRTPVYDAVKRLSANRLLRVQPRSGLRVAPLDFNQERVLLPVRIEAEAIACRLAAERCTDGDRTQMSEMIAQLRDGQRTMSLQAFNIIDHRLNAAILIAAQEPLLGHTLTPLQTLYRRSGWLFHTLATSRKGRTLPTREHAELLEAICDRAPARAEKHVRHMLKGVYGVLDTLQAMPGLSPHDGRAAVSAPRSGKARS